eukprot:TRINITY_DN5207_c0_g1_i1.p1 TRINITY_DN5207_c0_g1~~TRINITY_DN5207_c0_g1_i1.p1  ORF type:complete len:557 (-),score=200.99 TRINITY_DN5207_c0_g1_i1:3-1673(-)
MPAKSVLLAETWDESIDPTGYWISEKLDGVRAYWDGERFYSRNGNRFYAPEFFTKDLPKKALDGELWCGRSLFQKCVSIVKKQKDAVEEDWKFVTYLVFDAPDHDGGYEDRVKWLNSVIKPEKKTTYAVVVGIKKCEGRAHLKKFLDDVNKLGGEGLMLRLPGSLYERRRSTTLLKVKTFKDDEALVIGHQKGEGRLQGTMGALLCKLSNGKEFKIGTGFSDAQRHKPPKKGSVVTFKFQELSNSGSPRFPVYLRQRTDLTWEEVLENAKTKSSPATTAKVIPALKKQHSILFSTVPSRDQVSGDKIVTNDDTLEDIAPAVDAAPTDEKQPCKYGANCYRSDKTHLATFTHPKSKPSPKPKQQLPCKFGAECYLKDPIHLAKYAHTQETQLKNEKEESEDEKEDETTQKMEIDDEKEEMISVKKSEWDAIQARLKESDDRLARMEALLKPNSDEKPKKRKTEEAVQVEKEEKEEVQVEQKKPAASKKPKPTIATKKPAKPAKAEEEEEPEAQVESDLKVCAYGAKCNRSNPQHFVEYSHPVGFTPPTSKKKLSSSK